MVSDFDAAGAVGDGVSNRSEAWQDGLTADSWLHVRGKTLAHLSAACIALPGRWAQWQGTAPTAVDELPFQPSCGLGPLRPPPL
ncbi:hypothetical protein [Streptomyces sp. NPDC058206]|uniref:hypothetical protein n=1 Tax=Streptomyces sp. NPDC058206 TaxID=3346382 RepID=UPI0036ED0A7C